MGCILCEHCTAACCRYVAVPLDKPRRPKDYDDVRWYLMHDGITVFIEDGDWYIQFQTKCRNLQLDHRCGIYTERPVICRDYEPGECDYVGGGYGYEAIFTRPEQVDDYYQKRTGKKLPSSTAIASRVGKRKRKKPA
ncbi:MAG: YkgJ family cysteine cluster protein [Planctomycetes bacterium]|nr:YkgJ family cysteine cluster protein [Planctomycetota bacterium]MBI3832999.1 YkgJ family cysteine cluster protein [Planctomycetota bacterium]